VLRSHTHRRNGGVARATHKRYRRLIQVHDAVDEGLSGLHVWPQHVSGDATADGGTQQRCRSMNSERVHRGGHHGVEEYRPKVSCTRDVIGAVA
jgi:hypothetical protein